MFEVFRRDHRRWDKNEVVLIYECCSILHNIIIRLVEVLDVQFQDGDDIINDLYNEEQ